MNGMDGMDKDSSATPWSSKLVRVNEKRGWCIGGAVKEMKKKTNNNKDVFMAQYPTPHTLSIIGMKNDRDE